MRNHVTGICVLLVSFGDYLKQVVPRRMPSKKKKYNSRFPPARIKRIMQADEEVGKVAAVVPVIICKLMSLERNM